MRDARDEAQKQWNAIACGELDGKKDIAEYFDRVEEDRYRQQPWAPAYFGFQDFLGKKVLEIGVGQGTDLMQFAKYGADCHGVDITENHLHLTARNFALRGKAVCLHKADAIALPFPDDTFDCVYSFGVVHHIPEIESVIAEARRVLKSGGKLMIAVYHKWSAFHLVKLVSLKGILKGDLFRLGYSGLLSTIETGADGKTVRPYVKLYTKAEMRKLLRDFNIDDLSVQQLFLEHFLPSALAGPLRNRPLPLSRLFGWYVAARASKS